MISKINLNKKKGDLPSLIIALIVILFIFGLGAIIFSVVFHQVNSELVKQPSFSNKTIDTINYVDDNTDDWLDYAFFFSFVGISIGLFISAIYIDTHPALVAIFIVLLVVAIVLAGVFSNAFVEIGESTQLAATYNNFTMTKTVINNLPLVVLAIGTIVVIILYAKGRSGSSYGGSL